MTPEPTFNKAWMIAALTGMIFVGPAGVLAQDEIGIDQTRVAQNALEDRITGFLGNDWSVRSQYREKTGSLHVFSDVVLQREDILIRFDALTAAHTWDFISGHQVSVHQGSLESFPIAEFAVLNLSGEGLGGAAINQLDCKTLPSGSSRSIAVITIEDLLARPNPLLRIRGARSLGETRVQSVQGKATLSLQNGDCQLAVSSQLKMLQINSDEDQMTISGIDLTSMFPAGTNANQGNLGVKIEDVWLSGPATGYSMDNLTVESSVPRAIISAYLPFWYDDAVREIRLREILFEEGADISASINGLDLDLRNFLPGNLAKSNFQGNAELRAQIRQDSLDGTIVLDFPGAIELEGDAAMTFSEGVMQVSAIQAPFLTNLEGLGLSLHSTTVLQDVTRLTGLRLSHIVPQMMKERMGNLPLIGGSYESEIAAIGAWLAVIEDGERGHIGLRPDSSVNLGMIGGLMVVDMKRALSSSGFSASPELP